MKATRDTETPAKTLPIGKVWIWPWCRARDFQDISLTCLGANSGRGFRGKSNDIFPILKSFPLPPPPFLFSFLPESALNYKLVKKQS